MKSYKGTMVLNSEGGVHPQVLSSGLEYLSIIGPRSRPDRPDVMR